MSRRATGSVALFVAASCWGGTYVTSKYALAYIGPFALVMLRYLLAAVIFVPLFLALRSRPASRARTPDRSDSALESSPSSAYLLLAALAGFVGLSISSWAQFIGTALSTAHAGALITSSAPAFMVLFGALLLHERVTGRKIAALIIASGGVAIVVGPGDIAAGRNAVLGDLFLVLAGITWALYSVLIRKLSLRLTSLAVTTYVTVFGVLLSLPFGVPNVIHARFSTAVWLNVLYIGLVSTALAYFLWNKGLQLVEAGTASIFFFAQPLTGTFFSWLFLGEHLNAGFFIGAALILGGVAIISLSPQIPPSQNGNALVR